MTARREEEEQEPRGPVRTAGPNTQIGRVDKTNPDVPTGSGYHETEGEEIHVPQATGRTARATHTERSVNWTEHRGATRQVHSLPGGGEKYGDPTPEPKQHEGTRDAGGREQAKPGVERGVGAGEPQHGEKTHPGSGKEPEDVK